jgi:hypothetical protein
MAANRQNTSLKPKRLNTERVCQIEAQLAAIEAEVENLSLRGALMRIEMGALRSQRYARPSSAQRPRCWRDRAGSAGERRMNGCRP